MSSTQPRPQFFKFETSSPLTPVPGVTMRTAYGSQGSLSLVRLEPDAEVPVHSHPHEQLGLVLEGVEILLIDGEEHHVLPQQAYVIPGGVEHGGRGGPEGCLALDIFIPTREDYRPAAATPLDALEPAEG
jgi:quercetin dioxygenase-like cupin family protein